MASPPRKVSRPKAVEPKAAEPSKPKILVFGKPGVGKTWVSLDFPKVYYIDTEGGADLAHYTYKLEKAGSAYFGPDQSSLDFKTRVTPMPKLDLVVDNDRAVIIEVEQCLIGMLLAENAYVA